MSAQEIIAELPKLTAAELQRVRLEVEQLAKRRGQEGKTLSEALLEFAGVAEGLPPDMAEIKQAVSKLPQRKKLELVQWLHTQVDDRLNDEEMISLAAEDARALDKREAEYAKRKAR